MTLGYPVHNCMQTCDTVILVLEMVWGDFCENVQTKLNYSSDKLLFINTPDSFAIPIGGEGVTWVCINLCL